MTQWTVLNCFDGGPFGSYAGILSSLGLLPYAPQCRLYFPLSTSNTITRRLPYPSEMYSAAADRSSDMCVGCQKFSISLLPLWTPCLPSWKRNSPAPLNFRICVSFWPLPASQMFPLL